MEAEEASGPRRHRRAKETSGEATSRIANLYGCSTHSPLLKRQRASGVQRRRRRRGDSVAAAASAAAPREDAPAGARPSKYPALSRVRGASPQQRGPGPRHSPAASPASSSPMGGVGAVSRTLRAARESTSPQKKRVGRRGGAPHEQDPTPGRNSPTRAALQRMVDRQLGTAWRMQAAKANPVKSAGTVTVRVRGGEGRRRAHRQRG